MQSFEAQNGLAASQGWCGDDIIVATVEKQGGKGAKYIVQASPFQLKGSLVWFVHFSSQMNRTKMTKSVEGIGILIACCSCGDEST